MTPGVFVPSNTTSNLEFKFQISNFKSQISNPDLFRKRISQSLPRHHTRHLCAVEHNLSIDDHRRKSFSVLMRILECRLVPDGSRIEDHEICREPLADLPAVAEVKC